MKNLKFGDKIYLYPKPFNEICAKVIDYYKVADADLYTVDDFETKIHFVEETNVLLVFVEETGKLYEVADIDNLYKTTDTIVFNDYRRVFDNNQEKLNLIFKKLSPRMIVSEYCKVLGELIISMNNAIGASDKLMVSESEELLNLLSDMSTLNEFVLRYMYGKFNNLYSFPEERMLQERIFDLDDNLKDTIHNYYVAAEKEDCANVLREIQIKLKERMSDGLTVSKTIPNVFVENLYYERKPEFSVCVRTGDVSVKVIAYVRSYYNDEGNVVVNVRTGNIHPKYLFTEREEKTFGESWMNLTNESFIVKSSDDLNNDLIEQVYKRLELIKKIHHDYEEWQKNK